MRRATVGIILGWLGLTSCGSRAYADGGTIWASEKRGALQITVFTAPTPFRAGPVDISVLVQDASTGEPLPQAVVSVRLSKPGQLALEHLATHDAATNKLLQAAQFEVPEPGRWQVEIQVDGKEDATTILGELEAAPALPRWRQLWPWIAWPTLPAALFVIHQALSRRRARLTIHHSPMRPALPLHSKRLMRTE